METDCNSNSPECICPCGCGCQNDLNGHDLPFVDKPGGDVVPCGDVGICASCAKGEHEIPPGDLSHIIELHENILAQMKCVQAGRNFSNADHEKNDDL